MKSKVLWALVALNVLLMAALFVPFTRPNIANAQAAGGAPGRPSEYLMIPGEVIGGTSALVYIIDEDKRELSAATLNQNGQAIDMMPPIPLDRVFDSALGGGGGGR